MSMDAAIAIAWDVLKSVVAPIKRQFGYVIYSKRHAQDLQKEVEELADEVDRVQNLAEEARNNIRNVYGRVTEWHASAEKALKEARGLLRDFQEASKTCGYETLPDPKCRYQFSRKAKDKIEVIQRLTQKCREFKELNDISSCNPASGNVAALTPAKREGISSSNPAPGNIAALPPAKGEGISSSNPAPGNVAALTPAKREGKDVVQLATVTASASFASTSNEVRDNDVFRSRASIIRDTMAALADNNHSVVGVYGMGGVGKSTLLADVERRIIEKKSFDWVTKADVSENPDIKKIQGEIADALDLTEITKKETISGRAKLLHGRLENEEREKKKVLIILDNLWKGLDLKSVGIPCGHDNKVTGCKLLLTSRFQDVLRREMSCDRDFRLEELKDEEAKRLFERTVGDKVHDDPFKSLVNQALQKCAGLPFLIMAMANIFKDADFYEWKDVLTQIEKATDIGISESVNKMLQLSYDRFKGKDREEVKSLLRLCVVCGVSKPSLENLVRYSVGLRLFREDSSMDEVRNRLNTLIQKLKATSLLLEDNEDVDGFKIHDLVRGFVASVSSREEPFLVWKNNDKLVTELPKDKLKSCTALCFPYVEMEELHEELDCPETRIFFLFTNNESLKVLDSCFNSMRKLMVLHLSRVCLTLSPSPFKFSKDLHTLCLDGCLLEDVTMIGELKGLHILSFVNSNIHRLPKEIGQLVELRLLDLSECSRLEIIEPGVLGSLMKLEELYMWNSFDKWNAMEQTPSTNAELIELDNKKNLQTLHVSIPDLRMLPEDLNVEKLTQYNIRIGGAYCYRRYKGSRVLELKLHSISDSLQKGCIQTLLGKTDYLLLDGLNGIESICSLSHKGFQKLKHLCVEYSPSIHYVLQSSSHTIFKMLESLYLDSLVNLEMICSNHSFSKSFSALKVIRVESCDKMKVLFPLSLLRELPQLEEIKVVCCPLMWELVEVDDCGNVELPKLCVLILCDLPNVKNFFSAKMSPSCSTSNDQVGSQVAFFDGQQVAFPSVETLAIKDMDYIEIIWDNQVAVDSFHKLKSLDVWRCNKLLNIVPFCILGRLKSLEILTVQYCDLLEVVFKLQPLNPLDGHPVAHLPLKRLELHWLPKLKCVWKKELLSGVKFQCLRFVSVYGCKSLTSLFPASLAIDLTQLEELEIDKCGIVQLIEKEDIGVPRFVFPKLTSLKLQRLRKLRCICIGKYVSHWPALKTLDMYECHKVKILASHPQNDMPFDKQSLFLVEKVAFPSLETLAIRDMDNIEIIWGNQVAADSFHKLKSLEVRRWNKLLSIAPSCILGRLKSLEILEVQSCDLLDVVFKLQPLNPLDGHLVAHLPLKRLKLHWLPKLRCVWEKELLSRVKFQCLRFVSIYGCKSLTSLFLASLAIDLTQLEELEIDKCGIVELIEKEDRGVPRFVFPKLTSLKLQRLTQMRCICIGKYVSHWPALKTLDMYECHKVEILASHTENDMPFDKQPLFLVEKVAFPNLETLAIKDMDNIEIIRDNQVAADSLHKIKSLKVWRCNKLLKIGWLKNLESLKVQSCDLLEVVFKLQPLNPLDGHPITNFLLERLKLDGLPKLKCVWDKELHNQVKFECLRFVTVFGCKSLTSLFPASVAIHLTQLEELEIDECGIVELIKKEDRGVPRFVFPKLTSLKLQRLTQLRCIYIGKYVSHWPALKTLDIYECHKVEILASHPKNDMPFEKQPLFLVEKVAFSCLETLAIRDMDNIEIICDNQVAADSFHKLKSLEVWSCSKLLNIFPSCILGWLESLESLEVQSCDLLEVVFKLQPLNPLDGHPVAEFPLERLKLGGLPKLKCVWDKELHNQVKFQCLRFVTVSGCKSLTSLFPTSVAIHLTQLEELEISECGIVELIEKEGPVPKVVFPRLTSLKLEDLIELKCIYARVHALCWPRLKNLEVRGCNKVEILASQLENEMPPRKQPLFLIEKGAFPNLQELKLDLFGRMEIWHGHFHDGEFFSKLRVLELHHFSKEFTISTCCFLQSLANLEKLVVCESYQEELSINIEVIAGPSHELEIILPFSFQHLTTLEMSNCDGLSPSILLPFSGFFQHLKTLDMSFCDGLSNIFTLIIARNLVELTKLRIINCKMLTEVICDEEGEEGLLVVFNQLKYIELDRLTRLRCFSSIKYTLMFPLLEDVIVSGCPHMKFFSKGPIEAPKLERVQVSIETTTIWFWKENLNITIQNMFEEMEMLSRVEFIQLSEFPELIGKWHSELNSIKSSWQLESLMVDKCPSFINAIPSKLMFLLVKMRRLQICDCESLEEIFDLEGLVGLGSTQMISSSMTLDLVNLPKLRRLWNKDLQGSLPYNFLYYITLYNCSSLIHAFNPSMAQCLANLSQMEIKECDRMEGVIEKEEGQRSMPEKITFPNLERMKLECLPNLTSFLSGKNQILECPNLIELTIAHCPKMSSLTEQSLLEIDHHSPSLFTPQVQFPRLASMVLSHMDNLIKIWTDSPQDTLTFEHLWKVNVENCKSLENLFPHWVATSLTQLQKLRVESCGIKQIVASGNDISHFTTAQFLFPQLTSLVFHDMPQLKGFCSDLHSLKWQFLEKLQVTHCDKLNMLSFLASMNKWAQRDNQHDLSDYEAHLSFEKGIPTLERLLLVDKDIHTIHSGKLSDDFFRKPKALTLACFHDENTVFPLIFLLQRFKNLQSLEVLCSSFEDIFLDEELVDEGKHLVLDNLKELKLSKLHNLKHVWREGYLVAKIFQSISIFKVWDCPSLTTIFPVVTSFQNLTELVVKNSSGLAHLVTVSAITNLMQLTDMTIIGCERMKEVVTNDENGERKAISLGKLERLTLQHLPSLECFSSTTRCSFRFPSLEYVEVEECSKMKIFSNGTLSTPKLEWVRLSRYEWDGYWEGDLNATIQKLSA